MPHAAIGRFRVLYLAAALLFFTPVAGHGQTTGKKPSHEDILRGFDIAALYADKNQEITGLGSGAKVTGVITKWTGPIRYRSTGHTYNKKWIKETEATLRRIGKIVGIKVTRAKDGQDANFVLNFMDQGYVTSDANAQAGCVTSWNADRWTGHINRVDLKINLNSTSNYSPCIRKGILHGFGLFGQPRLLPSVTNYYITKNVLDLTEIDTLLLHILYDPRMKPGTSRLAAIIQADGLIEEKRSALNLDELPKTNPGPVLAEIVQDLKKAAGSGDGRAMLHLAEAYRHGFHVEKNEAEMENWLRRGEALRDLTQRFSIAYALQFGHFVPTDKKRAAEIYIPMVEFEKMSAVRNNLGLLLRDGEGVEKNPVEALKWFMIVAQENSTAARHRDRLISQLKPTEVEEAKARAEAWKPKPFPN